MRREEIDRVAAHAEGAAAEIGVGALVVQRDEIGEQLALLDLLALGEREGHRRIGLDRADAVDAGDGGDDDDVVALEQRARRRMAHAVDLLVDGGFLLDVGVGARDVRLRLVVVVVGDEILDRVVREERLELAVELGGERLVGREDERRALRRLDDLGRRVGLARAGDAEQHLVALLRVDAGDELRDRRRLVALRLEIRNDLQRDAALGLLRARRAMRHPGLVAELRPARLDQRRQRLDRRGDRVLRQRADVLEVDVEPRHRAEADGGALLGRAAPAHGRAAGGTQGLLRRFAKTAVLRGSHGRNMGDRMDVGEGYPARPRRQRMSGERR